MIQKALKELFDGQIDGETSAFLCVFHNEIISANIKRHAVKHLHGIVSEGCIYCM